jgi:hypothetical protein
MLVAGNSDAEKQTGKCKSETNGAMVARFFSNARGLGFKPRSR